MIKNEHSLIFIFGILLLPFFPCSATGTDNCIWYINRGNPALTGFSGAAAGDKWELAWTFDTADKIKSSPVIKDNMVFIASTDGSLYALNLNNGKKLWQFTVEDGFEAAPLIIFDTVFIGALNGMLYAIDPQTGKQLWNYKTGGQIAGSANAFTLNNGTSKRIVTGSYDNQLHCIDAGTGRGIWIYKAENYINGTPSILNDRIVFGGCDAQIRVINPKNGKEILHVEAGSYIPGSVALENNFGYTGHYGNQVICADLTKGVIVWKYGDEETGAAFFSSPALSRDRVLIGDRDGTLHCIDKKSGKKVWLFPTEGGIDCSPVVTADRVIFGSADGFLYLLSLTDGKVMWSYETGGSISGSPAVVCGYIIAGADDNRVYAFREKKK